MTTGEILFAILTGLAINECCEISPWAARRLVRWSARRRYLDPARVEIRAEELAALIDDRPGKLFKLITALGFVAGAVMASARHAIAQLALGEKASRWLDSLPNWLLRLLRRQPSEGPVGRIVQRLIAGSAPVTTSLSRTPVVLLDTSHQPRAHEMHFHTGFVNEVECEWVVNACHIIDRDLVRRGEHTVTVNVLTFYRAQALLIRRRLSGSDFPGFRALRVEVVDTIDRAQGFECDLVMVSFVRARRGTPPTGFGRWLQDVRRLTVTFSRARRGLLLVGHAETLRHLNGVSDGQDFYADLFHQMNTRPDIFGHVVDLQVNLRGS